jgi:hypothetical protein
MIVPHIPVRKLQLSSVQGLPSSAQTFGAPGWQIGGVVSSQVPRGHCESLVHAKPTFVPAEHAFAVVPPAHTSPRVQGLPSLHGWPFTRQSL